jgi:beta-galactosidase
VTVEVYADADEVELVQDGRPVGRATIDRFCTQIETTYTPGLLRAIAYRNGNEVGRTELRSARGDVHLRVTLDREQISNVAFVAIELVDETGTVHTTADRMVEVSVDGPSWLQGLGIAAPIADESFLDSTCRTYRGRALAAVRPPPDRDGPTSLLPPTRASQHRSASEEEPHDGQGGDHLG